MMRLVRKSSAVCCALGAATLCLALAGCSQTAAPQDGRPLASVAERGPLRLSVDASPRNPRVGDTVAIALTFAAPADYTAELPGSEALGEAWDVRKIDEPEPTTDETGTRSWKRTFYADVYRAGPIEIPALTVKYGKQPAPSAGDPSDSPVALDAELSADPLTIDVVTALTSQDTIATPRDITGTRLPPTPPLTPLQWFVRIAIALVALAALVALVWLISRRMNKPAPPIPADVWARQQLNTLEAGQLLTRDGIRAFYYRLSEIVRAYIERQFDLAAPEMTTEEFLVALADDRSAVPYDAESLREFLEQCDMVKYAALEVDVAAANESIAAARRFVDATADAVRARADAAARERAAMQQASAEGRAA